MEEITFKEQRAWEDNFTERVSRAIQEYSKGRDSKNPNFNRNQAAYLKRRFGKELNQMMNNMFNMYKKRFS